MAVEVKTEGQLGFNPDLSPEQLMVRETVREYAEERLMPTARQRERDKVYPRKEFEELAQMGFAGMGIPEEYGGTPLDSVSQAIVVEEISRADAAVGVVFCVHLGLVASVLIKYGTEEQKKKWLPKMASGEILGAYSLSEPGSGSDAAALICRAERQGDYYVLNGTKSWVTNGAIADLYLVFVRTDPDAPKKSRGISAIFVEKGTPGFEIGKIEDKMGMNASDTAELIFKDCKVPAENLLGEENKGFYIAMQALDASRVTIAAQALGIAQGAFECAVKYLDQRVQFGKKLREIQALQNYVTDMATRIEAARLLVYRAAALKDKGVRYTKESAMAKLFASETAMYVSDKAVQLLGGYGYTKEFPAERYFREAKLTEIYEGTSEILRIVVARNVFQEFGLLER